MMFSSHVLSLLSGRRSGGGARDDMMFYVLLCAVGYF